MLDNVYVFLCVQFSLASKLDAVCSSGVAASRRGTRCRARLCNCRLVTFAKGKQEIGDKMRQELCAKPSRWHPAGKLQAHAKGRKLRNWCRGSSYSL